MKYFTLYYLFKMQPNALLILTEFYYLQKVGVTPPLLLRATTGAPGDSRIWGHGVLIVDIM
jgi:hypothetical protein